MVRKALLVLQGGGALGAYQCGAYKAIAAHLARNGMTLAGIAGASIGAINGALIARHQGDADRGAGALEAIWRDELANPLPTLGTLPGWYQHCWNGLLTTLFCGNPGLSAPNYLAWSPLGEAFRAKAALHDTSRMRALLGKYFGSYGPNPGQEPRLLVRAVNASTQGAATFDSWRQAIEVRHVVASASIPFLYPTTDIDGETYWDGDFMPQSPLRDLLRAIREGPGDASDEYQAIIVDTVRGERHRPTSALDLLFQVQAGLMEPRADSDEDYAALNNQYFDFISAAAGALGADPTSALERRVAEESAQARRRRLCRLDLVRIRRDRTLPYEYVSRDLDYSAERVHRLINQGYDGAQKVLAGAR